MSYGLVNQTGPTASSSWLSMIFDIFRRNPPPSPSRDVAALVKGLTIPAVRLVKSDEGSSYLGGEIALPIGMEWPSKGGKPLTLLANLELGQIHEAFRIEWLPPSGRLLFFYDVEEQPWGFDPKDRGSWIVLFVPGNPSGSTPDITPLPRKAVRFARVDSIPSYERPGIKELNLSDTESDLMCELEEMQYEGQPQHHVAGFPSPIQGDGMELEAQLASSGIYCGDEAAYKDPRVAEMKARASEWRLLLQFDSDDDLNVMWGDCGRLYFWVREQDARAGRFDNAWLVLQCS